MITKFLYFDFSALVGEKNIACYQITQGESFDPVLYK